MKVQRQLGEFIRKQRQGAKISLHRLSELAGVSKPYLSQIERGLRRPSAEILQAIAKGLRISSQTLYVKAGILEEEGKGDVHTAVIGDRGLTERQKQVLLQVYESFREETARRRAGRRTVARGGARGVRSDGSAPRGGRTGTAAAGRPRATARGRSAPVASGREGGDAG
ncbi:MAG: helix-turn-helix transcriptional regulator [Actinobacteria bacterium]|nr:helix-turn-helix transcriptional regulator [Actinomycetota bacterium]